MARASHIFRYNFWSEVELCHTFFCCIARIFCSACFYMISSVWSDVGISLCITIEVRWNASFYFLYVHFSSNILSCIFLSKTKTCQLRVLVGYPYNHVTWMHGGCNHLQWCHRCKLIIHNCDEVVGLGLSYLLEQ